MNLEITHALRAYFTDQAFRNAIDGLMPRIDGSKAIQAEKIDEYREFNNALLTAAQVRHDLIAFLISACEISYLEAVQKYKWYIDWDNLPPSKVLNETIFSIIVEPEAEQPYQFEFIIEINLSNGTLILGSNYYNESKDKYLHVRISDEQAKAADLMVKTDVDKIKFLSSEKFMLSNLLADQNEFAASLTKVGKAIVELMLTSHDRI